MRAGWRRRPKQSPHRFDVPSVHLRSLEQPAPVGRHDMPGHQLALVRRLEMHADAAVLVRRTPGVVDRLLGALLRIVSIIVARIAAIIIGIRLGTQMLTSSAHAWTASCSRACWPSRSQRLRQPPHGSWRWPAWRPLLLPASPPASCCVSRQSHGLTRAPNPPRPSSKRRSPQELPRTNSSELPALAGLGLLPCQAQPRLAEPLQRALVLHVLRLQPALVGMATHVLLRDHAALGLAVEAAVDRIDARQIVKRWLPCLLGLPLGHGGIERALALELLALHR